MDALGALSGSKTVCGSDIVREQIIAEIQRLAKASGGQPPGRRSFETETGIREGAWFGVYWSRWGDALKEAGYSPNSKNEKLDEEFVLSKIAAACRHYGKMPAFMEFRLYKKIDSDFPNEKTLLNYFGGKRNLIQRVGEWARTRDDYKDIAEMIPEEPMPSVPRMKTQEGIVYMIKSGAHYKIGRSDELERRVKEIRIALPEAATLVHSIRTDDPAGIEAYWHRRFADRRANGEWFKLTNSDLKAFKKRKYQ